MLKISDAASLALHTASLLAAFPQELHTTRKIASVFWVSEAHLSKVLQRLAKHGLVKSFRGPGGGFALNRPGETIRLIEIYEAVEGPLEWKKCLLGHDVCPIDRCLMGDLLENVNQHVHDYLTHTRLSDLASSFPKDKLNP